MTQTIEQSASILASNMDNLVERDKVFAVSLMQQSSRSRGLSDKQVVWLHRLADRSQGLTETKPEDLDEVGSLTGLYAMLEKAAKKLKHPRIDLALPDDSTVRISKAPASGRNPNSLYVKRKAEGSWAYIGKVSKEGQYAPTSDLDVPVRRGVSSILTCMSEKPQETASAYGHLKGSCCFCGLTLSDERSVAVGYGKTCAENYDLPWGK